MIIRPPSVNVIGCLFAVVGTVGLVYHATRFKADVPFQWELLLVCIVRLLAIVCGVFLVRGNNWARWALLAWMAYHVFLSAFHPLPQLITHCVLLVLLAYMLTRPNVAAYFRSAKRDPG